MKKSKSGKIGINCKIHPTAVIGDNVTIGDNCYIGAYCVIGGDMMIDNENVISGIVEIGNNNLISNAVIILSPWRNTITRIGDNNSIYSQNFIGHDVIINDHIIMTSGCRIAGVCFIDSYVYLGMGTVLKNRVSIGEGVRTGCGTIITNDILPYSLICNKNGNRILRYNEKGNERKQYDYNVDAEAQQMFKYILKHDKYKTDNPILKKIQEFKENHSNCLLKWK